MSATLPSQRNRVFPTITNRPQHRNSRCKRFAVGVLLALIASVLSLAYADPALAKPGDAHDGNNIGLNMPDWMSDLPDFRLLSQLSIPGTHDSLTSKYSGDFLDVIDPRDDEKWIHTQSVSFNEQLRSGVRFFDIRVNFKNGRLGLFHGEFFLDHYLGHSVLQRAADFLDDHPTEFVLLRLKNEGSLGNVGRQERFERMVHAKLRDFRQHLWLGDDTNPTVGDMRGKIVIIDDFKGQSVFANLQWSDFDIQDDYDLSESRLDSKLRAIQFQLNDANRRFPGEEDVYVNFLSGTGAGNRSGQFQGLTPWKVASGKEVAGYEGTNAFARRLLEFDSSVWRTGIVVADFPGKDLISQIIAVNFREEAQVVLINKALSEDGHLDVSVSVEDSGLPNSWTLMVDWGDGDERRLVADGVGTSDIDLSHSYDLSDGDETKIAFIYFRGTSIFDPRNVLLQLSLSAPETAESPPLPRVLVVTPPLAAPEIGLGQLEYPGPFQVPPPATSGGVRGFGLNPQAASANE